MAKKSEPVRFYFTDESPFTVTTAEGDVKLGLGWLAITEEEYKALSARANITERQLKAFKSDRRELRELQDAAATVYLSKPYYSEEEMEARLPNGTRRIR